MARHLPLRLILEVEGVPRSFVSVYPGRDNSFYFHPYRPDGEPWRTPKTSPYEDGTKLHLADPDTHDFKFHKLSFHPSGVVHLADTQGQRFRDGVRVAPFEEASLPYTLCCFAPCDPARLPSTRKTKAYNCIIPIPGDVHPFYFTFHLVTRNNIEAGEAGPYIKHPRFFFFDTFHFGLAMTMWPVRMAPGITKTEWPPYPLMFYRGKI